MLRGEPRAEVLDLAEPAGLREVACVHEHVAARQLAEATVLAVRVRDADEANGAVARWRFWPRELRYFQLFAAAATALEKQLPRFSTRERVRLGREGHS